MSSTRQFMNTFLVGEGDEEDDAASEDAVVTLARLPYDRISVDATNGSEPITFISNDVVSKRQRSNSTRTPRRCTMVAYSTHVGTYEWGREFGR